MFHESNVHTAVLNRRNIRAAEGDPVVHGKILYVVKNAHRSRTVKTP